MIEQVGFLTPENEKLMMQYSDVSNYCRYLCEQPVNEERYNNFKKDYTYFEPYFDFVMIELGYVFINPLCEQRTFLKAIRNGYYKINPDELIVTYEQIKELAMRTKNGKEYAFMEPCSDKQLNIKKINIDDIRNCMIDPNGYAMMASLDEEDGNHEVTSNIILNQLLIKNENILKLYDSKFISIPFLIKTFGFLQTTSPQHHGYIIGVEKILTPEVKEYSDLCVAEHGCTFFEYDEEKSIYHSEHYCLK